VSAAARVRAQQFALVGELLDLLLDCCAVRCIVRIARVFHQLGHAPL
jgi:hypothetical protein